MQGDGQTLRDDGQASRQPVASTTEGRGAGGKCAKCGKVCANVGDQAVV